jgi:hypothetical protein
MERAASLLRGLVQAAGSICRTLISHSGRLGDRVVACDRQGWCGRTSWTCSVFALAVHSHSRDRPADINQRKWFSAVRQKVL